MKARFQSDPKAVLAEHGIDVPDGIDVNVIENTGKTVHITMPVTRRPMQVIFQMKNSGCRCGGFPFLERIQCAVFDVSGTLKGLTSSSGQMSVNVAPVT